MSERFITEAYFGCISATAGQRAQACVWGQRAGETQECASGAPGQPHLVCGPERRQKGRHALPDLRYNVAGMGILVLGGLCSVLFKYVLDTAVWALFPYRGMILVDFKNDKSALDHSLTPRRTMATAATPRTVHLTSHTRTGRTPSSSPPSTIDPRPCAAPIRYSAGLI